MQVSEAEIADWLQRYLPDIVSRVSLGILCAGQGLRLDQLSSPRDPLPSTVGRLAGHLAERGRLLAFAEAVLVDEAAGPRAHELGLPALVEALDPPAGPRAPQVHHRLPPVRTFVGRSDEMARLDQAWQEGARVLAVTGPPGCGKSALLQGWLESRGLSDPRRWPDFGVEGLFVWSFSIEPDVPSFLRAAADYVEGRRPLQLALRSDEESRHRDLARLLRGLDRTEGHILLVLDGLERFQAGPPQEGPRGSSLKTPQVELAARLYRRLQRAERPGEIVDPSLRALLVELSAIDGEAALLCTLERPAPVLSPWQDSGYVVVPVPPLSREDGARLLRKSGVSRGSDADAEQRSLEHRGHALTIELLGRYLSAYYHGDARAVTVWELPPNDSTMKLPEAPTLFRVLKAQVQALVDPLRGLLELCVILPGPTRLSSLLALSQAAMNHLPAELPVQAVLVPLRGLAPAELRARLYELERLGLLFLLEAEGGGEDALVVDVHPLLRRQLYRAWLDQRGGRALAAASDLSEDLPRPQDNAILDLLEQLVLVALEAGLLEESYDLLVQRVGGYMHLGRNLGEYRRLLAVLRILSPVICTVAEGDPAWARRCALITAWEVETQRDLGQLAAALTTAQRRIGPGVPGAPAGRGELVPGALHWQAEIYLLQGELQTAREVAARALQSARSVALRVRAAVLLSRALLLLGDVSLCRVYLTEAELALKEEPLAACEWSGLSMRELVDRDRMQLALRLSDTKLARELLLRCQNAALRDGRGKDLGHLDILWGEAARRERDPLDAAQAVHRALNWGSRTGDAEVLVRAGLCHARIRMDAGNLDGAASALGMALPTATELGFGIDHIDLLLVRGHLLLRRGDIASAETDARDALAHATALSCGYLWGEADALHLLALVLLAGRAPETRILEAVTHLSDEIDLRERMLDPRAQDVRWLLRRLTG